MQDTYLTAKDVAKRYSISQVTVWRWAKQGIIPAPLKLSENCTRWSLLSLVESEEKRLVAQASNSQVSHA